MAIHDNSIHDYPITSHRHGDAARRPEGDDPACRGTHGLGASPATGSDAAGPSSTWRASRMPPGPPRASGAIAAARTKRGPIDRRASPSDVTGPPRTGPKDDRVLRQFRRELQRVIAELRTGRTANGALHALAQAHAKLELAFGKDGAPHARRLAVECIREMVQALAPKQLEALLKAGAGLPGPLEDETPLRGMLLLQIRQAAHDVALARGEESLRRQAVGLLLQSPGGIDRAIRETRDGRRALRESLGAEPDRPPGSEDRFVLGAVADGLTALPPRRRDDLLAGVSSQQLADLKAAQDRDRTDEPPAPPADAVTATRLAIDAAAADLLADLLASTQAAVDLARDRTTPARIADAEKAIDGLRTHCERHGLRVPPLDGMKQRLAAAAGAVVQRADVSGASAEQLLELAAIADRHGQPCEHVRQEAAGRHAELAEKMQQTLHAFLGAAIGGDPVPALERLADLDDQARALRALGAAAGGGRREVDDVDEVLARCLTDVVPEWRTNVLAALVGDFGADALEALGAAAARPQPSEDARVRLGRAAAMLERVFDHLVRADAGPAPDAPADTAARGARGLPRRAAEIARVRGRPVPAAMQLAVAKVFGARVPDDSDDVRSGLFQGAFRDYLLSPEYGFQRRTSPAEQRQILLTPTGPTIGEQCFKDAARLIDLRLPDGRPLVPPEMRRPGMGALSDDEKAALLAPGFAQLVAAFGGTKQAGELVAALTLQACQTCTAPFITAFGLLADDDSNPAVLDGVRGNPTQRLKGIGTETATITFLQGPGGQGRLRLDFESRGGLFAGGPEGVRLDPERGFVRASVLLELVDDTGSMRVVGEPSYELCLVRSPCQKTYPQPDLSDLYGSRSDVEVRRDFASFTAEAGGREIVDAAHELQLLGERRSLAQAERAATAAARAHERMPEAGLDEIATAVGARMERVRRDLVAVFDPVMEGILQFVDGFYPQMRDALARRTDWPKGEVPPESFATLLSEHDADALKAFYAELRLQPDGAQVAEFLEQLAVLDKQPGVAAAQDMLERWIGAQADGAAALPVPIPAEAANRMRAALAEIAEQEFDAGPFESQQSALTAWTLEALPRFHEAYAQGRL
jgi:hypothetical protein